MIQDDIARFNLKAKELSLGKIKSGFIALSEDIRASTPADTGRLKNNWFPSVNVGSTETTESTGNELKARLNSLRITLGDTLYLTNNLPYAGRIEFEGHSKKAPAGMVRINIVKWSKYFA